MSRRFVRASFVALALSSLGLLGCPIGHQSAAARAQEAGTELNVNTRFGRMELASERVAPSARDAFLARRKAWGGLVRIADYELAGFSMKGDSDAEMLVKVAWYRANEGDLRMTTLKQKWHDHKGDWYLVDESRADGDVGLIGEPTTPPSDREVPKSKPKNAQFATIRLGQTAPEPTEERDEAAPKRAPDEPAVAAGSPAATPAAPPAANAATAPAPSSP